MRFHTDFTRYGLLPREISGLKGILTSPLIHSGFSHLWSNTVPIAVLLFFLNVFYSRISIKVIIWGWLLSGLFTWVIARDSYHIGASGMVYMLASFIFFKGIFINNYRQIAASLIVVFLYGSLIWYVLPIEPGISWEGHLCGGIAGLVLAVFVKQIPDSSESAERQPAVITIEEQWFMQQFDEDGNFSPVLLDEEE
jgi:membrane associated rhomboid family serine protease